MNPPERRRTTPAVAGVPKGFAARDHETAVVRDPHIPAIERVIARYDYSQLYYGTFFRVEGAWWR